MISIARKSVLVTNPCVQAKITYCRQNHHEACLFRTKAVKSKPPEPHLPLPDPLPEVFTSSTSTSRAVGRRVQAGTVRKIGPRLYTPNMTDPPDVIVRRNLWRVVGLLIPGAVVGYRTGFRGAPSVDGSVFVVGKGRQTIDLPGHRIQMVPGPGPLDGDQHLQDGVTIASRPRAIL